MASTKVDTTLFGSNVSYSVDGRWLAYWSFLLRLIVGWWLFHAGIHKLLESGVSYNAKWFVTQEGLVLSPVMNVFSDGLLYGFVQFMVPVGETLIGLGLLVGCLVRLASFFGAFLMIFFVTTNRDWANGFVNGDLMGLLLFATMIVLAAGRIWGIDAYLEQTSVVKNNPWLRYLLG